MFGLEHNMKWKIISFLLYHLAHQYIIIDFGFPCLLNIMIYFCFHSNTHFYSHSMQNRISYSISWVHIELCGKSYSMKVVCTIWREIFHMFWDPPYNMGSKSQNKLFQTLQKENYKRKNCNMQIVTIVQIDLSRSCHI